MQCCNKCSKILPVICMRASLDRLRVDYPNGSGQVALQERYYVCYAIITKSWWNCEASADARMRKEKCIKCFITIFAIDF